jgi:hypothetical protein
VQEGAFLRLLRAAWRHGARPGSLPNSDAYFAERSGLGAQWKKLGAPIRAHFAPDPGAPDMLRCDWLATLYEEQLAKHDAYVQRGKMGGRPRKKPQLKAQLKAEVLPEVSSNHQLNPKPNHELNHQPSSTELELESFSLLQREKNSPAVTPPPAALAAAQRNDNSAAKSANGPLPPPLPQPLPPAARELLARVPDSKREDSERQLRAALDDPKGAKVRQGSHAKASSREHLDECCRYVLENPPDDGPPKFALCVLLRIRSEYSVKARVVGGLTATAKAPRLTPTQVFDELKAALQWLADQPDDVRAEIDAEAAAKFDDEPRRVRHRENAAIARWHAVSSPINEPEASPR